MLLLRSAPDTCKANQGQFQARIECVRMNPGKQSLHQRKFTQKSQPSRMPRVCLVEVMLLKPFVKKFQFMPEATYGQWSGGRKIGSL